MQRSVAWRLWQIAKFGSSKSTKAFQEPARPPVVAIMGHVNHGKTSLLDALRKTSVAQSEAGGITQRIGAFGVALPSGRITFLDTPGHAAFSAMRARGAHTTDIVVLVVAADDGVMPQTLEAIKHAQSAGVPLVVAINKCDKLADTQRIRRELAAHGVLVEDFGGDVPCVHVSALAKTGLAELEETIVALAEVCGVAGDPRAQVEGVVLESRVDKGRGNVATVLVTRGTLAPGVALVAGNAACRVRTMRDENAIEVRAAPPSTAVEVAGWKSLPSAGERVAQAQSEAAARAAAEDSARREQTEKTPAFAAERVVAEKTLPIVIKADAQGSLEALGAVMRQVGNAQARAQVISAGVGDVTPGDVRVAAPNGAHIFAFNVRAGKQLEAQARRDGVVIHASPVIYDLIERLKRELARLLPMDTVEEQTGEMEVTKIFEINVKGGKAVFAGCKVRSGRVAKKGLVRVLRRENEVFTGALAELKFFKKDVEEITKSMGECVAQIDGFAGIKEGDIIRGFVERQVQRQLE